MNVQIEKLENHIARLKVEIEPEQLEKAKRSAAKRLSKRVRIDGFRKGKAPYHILVNLIGEGPIIEDAIEDLGNEIYKKALDESDLMPYTTGSLEDFLLDPKPTFVFTVPMQPTVELNDYKSVRVEYSDVQVEDKDVDEALKRLQEQQAVVEDSSKPAAIGDRVIADIHGFYIDEDEDDHEHDHDHDDEDADEHEHYHNAPIHQHDAQIYLDVEREPLPGFAEKLVGTNVDEDVVFELTYPEDAEKYGEFSGRKVRFELGIKKVENVTLPALNDDFAANVTKEEDEPLTLLQLRARLRENLQSEMEAQNRADYADQVMDKLVEIATFAYPEAMVINQIDSMIDSMSQRFGLTSDDYLRLLQKSREDLHQDETYRESAIGFIKRSLIMRGILDEEKLQVSSSQIDEQISKFLTQFGEQSETYRSLFDTPEMRNSMINNLLEEKIMDRIVAIGKGEEITSQTDVTDSDETLEKADQPESSEENDGEESSEQE